MAKYSVYGTVTGSKYLGVVEAATKEEAEELALEQLDCYVSLCHECAHEINDPEISDVVAEKVEKEGAEHE